MGSKYISLLTEKEIQKIFEGLEKSIEVGKSNTRKNVSPKKVLRNKIEEKLDDQKTEQAIIGKRCNPNLKYFGAVIGKLVNRKNSSYFKECLYSHVLIIMK